MPPNYSAFFDLRVISNKHSSKVESIATWKEHFFFGTDSRINVYQILGLDTPKPESKPRAVIPINASKSLPVKQIALLPEKNCMVVLCGESLLVHNLPSYETICKESVPPGVFDLAKDAIKDPGDVGGFHIKRDNGKYVLVAFTSSRKVIVFEYYDSSKGFKRLSEYPVPEKPRSVMWVGQRILLAFKGSYTLLSPNNIAAKGTDVLPEVIMDTGRSGESCVCNLDPHMEYLIGIDTIGGRVPISGKAPSAGCKWQSVPMSISYRDPYVLAVHSDSVEIYYPWRNSHSNSLVHSLTRKGANRISQRSFVRFDDPPQPKDSINDQRRDVILVVDSSNSVSLLHMLTVDKQVKELINQNEFELALELCDQCALEVEDKTVKTAHFQYAMSKLFSHPDIDTLPDRLKAALEHFIECDADPQHVISLFPNFLPRELSQHVTNSKTLPLDKSPRVRDACLEHLLEYLESHRSRIGPDAKNDNEKQQLTSIDTALLKVYIYLRKEDKLITSLLNSSHHCAVENCTSFLLERKEWVALALFRRSKGLHEVALRDLRILGSRGELPDDKPTPTSGSASAAGGPSSSAPTPSPQATLNLPTIREDVIELITSKFSHSEIITRKFLTKAVIEAKVKEVANEQGMSDRARGITVNQVVGVLTSLTYLRTSLDVTSSYQLAQLHTEYSKWLLRDLPPAIGVTLFTNLDIQGVPTSKVANFFDPTEVVKILDTVSGGATTRVALVSAYLQIVLGDDCNGHPKEQLHDLQVKVLLELIAEQRGATDKADTAADKKLLQFLEKSKAYNPKTVQQWLDQGAYAPSLFRQRAVVYQRQNLHQKAITMFLQEARDMAAAQAYATSASKREEGGGADNAFQILLQELTRPNDADTKEITTAKTQQALKVINSCEGVDAKTALPMLPDETLLADLSSFLIASLRASHTNRRNLEIAAAVSTTQMNQTRTSELLHKKRYVIVDDASMCCKCGFKIRIDTMFAVFPNGNVAHQLCYDDDKVDPGTHEDFSKGVHTIFLQ